MPQSRLAPVWRALLTGGLLMVVTSPGSAGAAAARDRSLTLNPSYTRNACADFHSDELIDQITGFGPGDDPSCNGDSQDQALGDRFDNNVYEVGLHFDLGPIHGYPQSIITRAVLSYDELFVGSLLPDGRRASDPHDVQDSAVFGSCVMDVQVPDGDWHYDLGLIAHSTDETVDRLDKTHWDVTNQVQHWYTEPAYANHGLVLVGFDEGQQYSNNAACWSLLRDFQLEVQFVGDDPPAPVNTGATERVPGRVLPPNEIGLPQVAVPTPVPPRGGNAAQISNVPADDRQPASGASHIDLTVSGYDVQSRAGGKTSPGCQANADVTFTARIQNVGAGASSVATDVSLAVDDVPRATNTVDPLQPGASTQVILGPLNLARGAHKVTITVNQNQKFGEASTANNAFTNSLSCA
jgi:hypothetical protein